MQKAREVKMDWRNFLSVFAFRLFGPRFFFDFFAHLLQIHLCLLSAIIFFILSLLSCARSHP